MQGGRTVSCQQTCPLCSESKQKGTGAIKMLAEWSNPKNVGKPQEQTDKKLCVLLEQFASFSKVSFLFQGLDACSCGLWLRPSLKFGLRTGDIWLQAFQEQLWWLVSCCGHRFFRQQQVGTPVVFICNVSLHLLCKFAFCNKFFSERYTWKGSALIQGGLLLHTMVVARFLKERPRIRKKRSTATVPFSYFSSRIRDATYAWNQRARRGSFDFGKETRGTSENSNEETKKTHLSCPNGTTVHWLNHPTRQSGSKHQINSPGLNNSLREGSNKPPGSVSETIRTIVEKTTGCSKGTSFFRVTLNVGCILVLLGHMSSISLFGRRAESFGIKSSQASALLPLYLVLTMFCRCVWRCWGSFWRTMPWAPCWETFQTFIYCPHLRPFFTRLPPPIVTNPPNRPVDFSVDLL